ncbi:MAG TPA: DNA repair protein RecO [Clostridia bacterium]|nr:DNA repair protein RecO [Clostridia bacterium]
MAFVNVTGIVTCYANYKDNDRMLTLFTRERGRVDAIARGCRRPKNALFSCAELFVFGEFQLFYNKERYSVTQCDVKETFYSLRENIESFRAAVSILELTRLTIFEEEPNHELFSLLYYTLSFLSYGNNNPLDMALVFIIRFLLFIGVCPMLTSCVKCGTDLRKRTDLSFSPILGGAMCEKCAANSEAYAISNSALEAMRRILLLKNENLELVRLPKTIRKELLAQLERYCSVVLEKSSSPVACLKELLPEIS